MSMNLNLYDNESGCNCTLYQTPTEDTYYILEGGTREAIFQRYMDWWKAWRLDGRKRLNKMDQMDYDEHKAKIERFLAGHPNARFGAI